MADGFFSASTPRILGTATTAQNLFHIFNGDVAKTISIYKCVIQMDATAVLTAVMPQLKICRTTGATGGTACGKVVWDSAIASDTDIVMLGAGTTDGSAASAITATVASPLWQQYGMRMHTVVGQVLAPDNNLIPSVCEEDPIVLRPNEGLLGWVSAAVNTSNPATNHYFIECAWSESTT